MFRIIFAVALLCASSLASGEIMNPRHDGGTQDAAVRLARYGYGFKDRPSRRGEGERQRTIHP